MEKIRLTDNLYQYQFPPFDGQHFGFNIYALINGSEALLIDTAFENHAKAVLEDLKQQGVAITGVVFSHFHPDHISGLPALESPKLYGSGLYQASLDKYTPIDKHHYFSDVNSLSEISNLAFGQFKMTFKLIQGHVICGLFTIINHQFVHVADDLMASNEGQPLLPSVHRSQVKNHIESLELLKNYSSCTLLLSHGNTLTGKSTILKAIQSRQKYLQNILMSEKPISVEEALEDCECDFLHKEWHNYVYC